MLFAKKENRSDFRIYLAMLNRNLDKNQEENTIFTTILADASAISKGDKQLYEVEHTIYPIIRYLVKNFSEELQVIDSEKLERDNYISLQGYMKKALNI